MSTFSPFSESHRFTRESALTGESVIVPSALPEQAYEQDTDSLTHRPYGTSVNRHPLKLSILMAAYNEESTITQAVDEILGANYPFDIELIVVDDGSIDKTQTLLAQFNDDRLIVAHHRVNQGKGAAVRTAASLATGTYVLPFDADMEYEAGDIPRILEPVLKGRCNVVYGVRLFGCNTVYRSYRYAMGNRMLTSLTNILFNANLSDLHTCLKLIPMAMLRELNPSEKGFGLDTEVTALMLRRGVRPFEVPVSYYGRSHDQGKKITWRDAFTCAWILFRVRFRRRSYGISVSQVPGPPEGLHAEPHARQEMMPLSVSQTVTSKN